MSDLPYEIDFLPVGDGKRSGDAIAVRYYQAGRQWVHVIDGGNRDSGEALCWHLPHYYGTTHVDHLVCSHLDDDHVSGLRTVLERNTIGTVWLNRPWLFAEELVSHFEDERLTAASLARHLRDAYPMVVEIEETAERRGIPIRTAFQGDQIGAFTVLAPSRARYMHLVPGFYRTPEESEDHADRFTLRDLAHAAGSVRDWILETFGVESLREHVKTTASNESSLVQAAVFADRIALLTADAGIETLDEAISYIEDNSSLYPLPPRFVQVPHHGGRHNVTPSILDRLLGETDTARAGAESVTAFASVASKTETHPRRMVVNGFIRRGATVYATRGNTKWHHRNMPLRADFSQAIPYEFFETVEPWED